MQITLNQEEVKQAIKDYIGNQGISISGKSTIVTFLVSRNPSNVSASVEISDEKEAVDLSVPTPRCCNQPTVIDDDEEDVVPAPVETEDSVAQKTLFG